ILTLLVIWLLAGSLSAQEVVVLSGYIRDASNGEVLIGASVRLKRTDIPNPQLSGALTNAYGYYNVSVPKGKYMVEYGYLGFEAQKIEVELGESLSQDVEMKEDVTELNEVVVTSKVGSIRSSEISTETISGETIEKLPAILGEPDVLRSIQLLPGVSSANEASSGFNVRGGGADQNLILLDEGIIYNASHLFGLFSVFNTDAINEVKLYKGGIPASYGGRLSSVLDVQQKEGNRKKFGGKASIGLISTKLLLEGPIAKTEDGAKGSFMLAGRRSYLDAFTFLSDDFDGFGLFFYDLNLKSNYRINDNNQLFLSGYLGRDNFVIPDFLGSSWGNSAATLRWTSIVNDKLFLQISMVYSNYDYNLDILTPGTEFRWESRTTNLNFKPQMSWFVDSRSTVRFGADVLGYSFNPAAISPLSGSSIVPQTFQEKRAVEGAAYVDAEREIGDRLNIRAGLRYSNFWRLGPYLQNDYAEGEPLIYNETTDTYVEGSVSNVQSFESNDVITEYGGLEPRLSLNYQLNDASSVKLGYNRTYQYIHLVSNTTSPTPLDIWTPSGEFLRPQFADQLSIGYSSNLSSGEKYELTAETFYKDLNDVTTFIDGADLLFTEDLELVTVQGNGRAYGLELQFEKKQGALTGWISYTLSRSELRVTGVNGGEYFPANFDQTHELSIVGLWSTQSRWDFGANWIYGSGRPVTYPSGKYRQNGLLIADYSTRNADRLPAYHRLDVSATLRPKPTAKREGTWVFSIANLYNRLNASSIFFREVGEVNGMEVATGMPEAVRLSFFGIVPSVSYQFKF
ncbi:MAG: TonB-dependent receptor, partial [Bacteroidota bacterium]